MVSREPGGNCFIHAVLSVSRSWLSLFTYSRYGLEYCGGTVSRGSLCEGANQWSVAWSVGYRRAFPGYVLSWQIAW